MLHSKMRCVASRFRAGAMAAIITMAVTTVSAQKELSFFVSATTITGEVVTDLKAEEVRITEDGNEGRTLRVDPVAWPVKLTVLVDNGFGTSTLLTPYRNGLKSLFSSLPAGVEASLLKAWIRSLIYATREDLLPDFRGYADALAAWPAATHAATAPRAEDFEGRSVRQLLDAVIAARTDAPLDPYFALMEAGARHLLRFDERHAVATDNSVSDNVGCGKMV